MDETTNFIPTFYINQVDLSHSENDFLFEMSISSPDSLATQVKIFMSPQHAKKLLYVLETGIKGYEENIGTINIREIKVEMKKDDKG